MDRKNTTLGVIAVTKTKEAMHMDKPLHTLLTVSQNTGNKIKNKYKTCKIIACCQKKI
jgi:hypothetical protein